MLAAAAIVVPLGSGALGSGGSYPNPAPIAIPGGDPEDEGPGSVYPSKVSVSGVGTVDRVTVTIHGLSHEELYDVDILLVGPTGVKVAVMSYTSRMYYEHVDGLTYTFDDFASAKLPATGPPKPSGTYRPSSYRENPSFRFTAPAPKPPYKTVLAAFKGTKADGVWRLYVYDTLGHYKGKLAGGWTLNLNGGAPKPSAPLCDGKPATIVGKGKIEGTLHPDVIVGSEGNDTIDAFDSNDSICALGGNDTINAGRNDDHVDAGEGKDTVIGGDGNDSVSGGSGSDAIKGQGGNDQVDAGPGKDEVKGGSGDDSIAGGTGNDTLYGGKGGDKISGGVGSDSCEAPASANDAVSSCEHILTS